LEEIDYLNSVQSTATFGINDFADWTTEEFSKRYLMDPVSFAKNRVQLAELDMLDLSGYADVPIPPEFDWNNRSAVTPVKNQRNCGGYTLL
jgi:hypothetical protein